MFSVFYDRDISLFARLINANYTTKTNSVKAERNHGFSWQTVRKINSLKLRNWFRESMNHPPGCHTTGACKKLSMAKEKYIRRKIYEI